MTSSQIFFYGFLLLIIVLYVRRMLIQRSVTNYDASTVAEKLKAKENILLLDVRTSGERSRNHIPGSTHIPLHELRRRMNELERYKEKEIICYCQSGSRSVSAAGTLNKNGFRAANLSGGISMWNLRA